MAAGVTLRKERLAEFRAYMESALAHDVAQSRHANEIFIDGAVSARAVTPELAATLNRAGPFGSGNPEPVLALPSHQLVYADEVGQAHLRVRFKSGDGSIVNGIAFRSIGQKLGNALDPASRTAAACGGIARGRSLAGHGARATARARRRGAGSRAGGH